MGPRHQRIGDRRQDPAREFRADDGFPCRRTKVLAGEGAPFNVLVNALLVGFINSDQHVQLAKKLGVPTEEFVAGRAKDIPMGRAGEAEEFANIACFLASDAASYIAGVGINVDGGHSPLW